MTRSHRRDRRSRRRRIAELSLAAQYRLREDLLPQLDRLAAEEAPGSAVEAAVGAYLDETGAALGVPDLPPKIVHSLVAAFALDALQRGGAPRRLRAAWFENERAPFLGTFREGTLGGEPVRTLCCVRFDVPDMPKCKSCPLRAELMNTSPTARPTRSA